ncbi:hypothetical protein [Paenibacillus xanthanilyticus]|uniref:Uncharacterized protein n=1 Tax=Paenibacillus xanthanilyticus TaxID=1783531 RepID=A0ABV8JYG1_9BACL
MRRWRLIAMAAGGLLLAGAVVYSWSGSGHGTQDREKETKPAQAAQAAETAPAPPSQPRSEAVPEAGQEQAKTAPAFAPLRLKTVPDADGFGMKIEPTEGLYILKTFSAKERIVHVIVRNVGEGNGGERLEAVIVNPGSAEVESQVLVEYPFHVQSGPRLEIDGEKLVFVRPVHQEGMVAYDLATFDPADGRVDVVAERFWSQPLQDGQEEDFLTGLHVSQGKEGAGGKVLLSSFRGRTWLIDRTSGQVLASAGAVYPAFGDPGSSPVRELLFPSPDLSRMVYQPKSGRAFQLLDPAGGKTVAAFGFGEEAALMSPGISWNAESTRFYQEFGDASRTYAASSDTGLHLYAQSVRFYDRNGKPERTFTLRGPADARMNVYGWASEHEVWLETFRVRMPKPNSEPEKRNIAYKRYDIRTGVLTDYRTAGKPEDLKQPELVQPVDQPAAFIRRSFLLADAKSKRIWPSPYPASAVSTEQGLYLHVPSDVGDALYRWTKEEPAWRWLDGRTVVSVHSGEAGPAWRFAAPVIHRDRWLVYADDDPIGGDWTIRYAKVADRIKQTAGGLPILPPSITDVPEQYEWWKSDSPFKPAEKTTGARAQGKSRYGTIRLKPLAGELAYGRQYYGDYAVSFKAKTSAVKELPAIQGLRLEQESGVSPMERIEFDGWDLLLFRTHQYRFSKGVSPYSPPYLRAFAVTREGEAFPLVFRYADSSRGVGERSMEKMPLDDNQPVRRQGKAIVLMAGNDQLELTLQPNLAGRELLVTGADDRRRESEQLRQLAERYTELIEQALGLDEYVDLPGGRMEAGKLIALFAEEAWDNPGFQRMKRDFHAQRASGHPSRAFSWPPIEIRSVSPDTVRFTMTLNLFYAIGHAAHLEVALKLEDGVWKIRDLGTLSSEKGDGVPGYDGLVIEDPLRLE